MAAALLFVPGGARAQAAGVLFWDDVETGTLFPTDAPPGRWSVCFPTPCADLSASPEAALRGGFGIRFLDPGSDVGANGVVNALEEVLPSPATGDLYLRTWLRFSETSSGTLRVVVFTVQRADRTVIQSVRLNLPAATLTAGGTEPRDGGTSFVLDGTSQVLSQGEWHLLEIALLGLGTDAGRRRLWIDGSELASHQVDWSGSGGWAVAKFSLGEMSSDPDFTGTLDYDDVAADVTPLPSHLAVEAPARAVVGGCVPLKVEARDTPSNAPAIVQFPLSAGVRAQGAGNLFASGDCSGTAAGGNLTLALPAGVSSAQASFQPLGRGAAQLRADEPDLLPGAVATLQVTGPAVRLAFPRAAPVAHPGECSPEIGLEQEDDQGATVVDGQARAVSLAASVPLYSDADCRTPLAVAALSADTGRGALHFRGEAAETFTLTATADGLEPASQDEQVSAPVARIVAPAEVATGGGVTLDGSGSTASQGATLRTFLWRELSGPTGVTLPSAPTAVLALKEPGTYVFSLEVTDSAGVRSVPATVAVRVSGAVPQVPTLGGCASAGDGAGLWAVLLGALGWRRRGQRAG